MNIKSGRLSCVSSGARSYFKHHIAPSLSMRTLHTSAHGILTETHELVTGVTCASQLRMRPSNPMEMKNIGSYKMV